MVTDATLIALLRLDMLALVGAQLLKIVALRYAEMGEPSGLKHATMGISSMEMAAHKLVPLNQGTLALLATHTQLASVL